MELQRIKEIAADVLGCPVSAIADRASFTEELGADSLELFRIILLIEEAFSVEIRPDEAAEIRTPLDALDVLNSLR